MAANVQPVPEAQNRAGATGSESEQINARLTDLAAQGKTLPEISEILNREFQRNFSREAYKHRAYRLRLKLRRAPGPVWRGWPKPICQQCGARMRRSSYLTHTLLDRKAKVTVIRFCCPQDLSHADEYRARPKGEKAEMLGRGRFRWLDSETGEWFETKSILPEVMRSEKIRQHLSIQIKRHYAKKRKELGLPRRRKKRPRPYRHRKAPEAMIPQLPCRHAGCKGNLRISGSYPLDIEGVSGEDVLKVTLRCGVCQAQAYWILPDGVEAIRIGNGNGLRTAHTCYEFPRGGEILRTKTRHTEGFEKRHRKTEERNAKLAFERRAKRYGPDIAAKWDTLTPGEKSRLIWASWTPAKRKRVSRKISNGLKQPEVQNIRRGKTKATWEKRNARMLPADLAKKPATYRMMVPVLIADRAAGGHISNGELCEMFGVTVGKQTMNDIRQYCGVPGPIGRPSKTCK